MSPWKQIKNFFQRELFADVRWMKYNEHLTELREIMLSEVEKDEFEQVLKDNTQRLNRCRRSLVELIINQLLAYEWGEMTSWRAEE